MPSSVKFDVYMVYESTNNLCTKYWIEVSNEKMFRRGEDLTQLMSDELKPNLHRSIIDPNNSSDVLEHVTIVTNKKHDNSELNSPQ